MDLAELGDVTYDGNYRFDIADKQPLRDRERIFQVWPRLGYRQLPSRLSRLLRIPRNNSTFMSRIELPSFGTVTVTVPNLGSPTLVDVEMAETSPK